LSDNIDVEDALVDPDDVFTLGLMDITSVSTLEEHLDQLRLSSAEDIELLLQNTINSERLPLVYWNALSNEDRITASRACLLAYAVTGGTQVPRELQLRACLATYHAHDSLIDTGTGSGKTLPIALNLLLDDPRLKKISLTISPLKRLQVTQVCIHYFCCIDTRFECISTGQQL
jgi:ATP-dependent helicase YprA (DUF1998 family)